MQATDDLTPLGHKILKHWSKYRPKMVATLSARNQLQQAIFAAQELTGNLLYELTVVQKMDYQIAWELATREWAFPPGRGGSAPTIVRSRDSRPQPTLTRDFRITERRPNRRGQPKRKSAGQSRRNPHSQENRGRRPIRHARRESRSR